jgi:hypothetical protein
MCAMGQSKGFLFCYIVNVFLKTYELVKKDV